MTDITELLRNRCHCNLNTSPCGAEDDCRIDDSAAKEIERLRVIINRAGALAMQKAPHEMIRETLADQR